MVKLTIGFSSEVKREKWHKKIIEMYDRGAIEFRPCFTIGRDGNLIISEISAIPTQETSKFQIIRDKDVNLDERVG